MDTNNTNEVSEWANDEYLKKLKKIKEIFGSQQFTQPQAWPHYTSPCPGCGRCPCCGRRDTSPAFIPPFIVYC